MDRRIGINSFVDNIPDGGLTGGWGDSKASNRIFGNVKYLFVPCSCESNIFAISDTIFSLAAGDMFTITAKNFVSNGVVPYFHILSRSLDGFKIGFTKTGQQTWTANNKSNMSIKDASFSILYDPSDPGLGKESYVLFEEIRLLSDPEYFIWPISIESKPEMQSTASQILLGGMYTQTVHTAMRPYIDSWDIVTMPLYQEETEECKKFIYDNLGKNIRIFGETKKQYTILNDNVAITIVREGGETKYVINFSAREAF